VPGRGRRSTLALVV